MFFPRVVAFDRLRGRFEMFAPCGVAAGIIARCDEIRAGVGGRRRRCGRPAPRHAPGLERLQRRSRRASSMPASTCCSRCASRRKFAASPRTLASGSAAVSDWRYLSRAPPRAVRHDVHRARHALDAVRTQCAAHLDAWRAPRSRLSSIRCTPKAPSRAAAGEQSYFVVCDERINNPKSHARRQDQPRLRFRGQQAGRIPRLHRDAPAERFARARRSA